LQQTLLENVWRRKGAALAVMIVAACVWVAVRLPQGLADLQEKRRIVRELSEQNAAMRLENEHRRERIHKLETSPSEQETEIRKQLKLVRPGETTFILPTPAPPPSPPQDPK
jgi:cell division protein FtsB